jgi:hypothetical protein
MTAIRKDVAKAKPKVCSKAKFDAVCLDVAAGEPTYKAIPANGVDTKSFYARLFSDEKAGKQYAGAKAAGLERMADDMQMIADQSRVGQITTEGPKGTEIKTADMVERARLQVDTRKWLLSKLAPRKYGDKVQTEITGADGGPVVVTTDYNALRNSLKNRG